MGAPRVVNVKRTVHFTRNQVFWECDHLCVCEVFPDGLPDCIRYDGKKNFAEDLAAVCPHYLALRNGYSHISEIRHTWLAFGTTAIFIASSRGSHAPPRIQGRNTELQVGHGHQFTAAYFGMDLPAILTPQSEIIDISTTRGGSDPTGPVIGGHILIKGSLGRVQIIDHKTGPILCREDEIKETYGGPVTFRGFDVSGLQFGLYYVLLLGTCKTDPDKIHSSLLEDDYLLATYLVLRPVIGQHGTFERCGLVSECYTEDDEHRTLTGRGLQSRQDIPCEEYAEHEGTYRIRII
ncbi:hypothetical protein FOYG_13915 [Fusarium oxysporum NRRL 32931]|uniref:Uncharacterized protein n=1 Tax=Fusarium oxysporum NRRL 32931 TaxID=660029 RepID=W9HTH2_FUSOX|nr:hypothetical protein FOYG_13915 [Fusarium oxysporum NRRL 32931]